MKQGGGMTSLLNIMVTDKPGQRMGNMKGGCCEGADKDHLQSMQSSTQHPDEEITWRERTVPVMPRELGLTHVYIYQ